MPYRVAFPRPSEPTPATELVYAPRKRVGKAMSLVGGAAVAVPAAFIASSAGYAVGGAAILALGAFLGIRQARTGHAPSDVILRIERERLVVTHPDEGRPLLQTSLEDLVQVELDTRSVEMLRADTSLSRAGVPGLETGPSVDVSRIVLVSLVEGAERVPLSEALVAHMDAIEWAGKIRRFLRAQGWLPFDERPADDF